MSLVKPLCSWRSAQTTVAGVGVEVVGLRQAIPGRICGLLLLQAAPGLGVPITSRAGRTFYHLRHLWSKPNTDNSWASARCNTPLSFVPQCSVRDKSPLVSTVSWPRAEGIFGWRHKPPQSTVGTSRSRKALSALTLYSGEFWSMSDSVLALGE